MPADTAAKRLAFLKFPKPGTIVPDGTIAAIDRAYLLGLYLDATPGTVADPVLELGTRAPNPIDGFPTSRRYLTAATLASNALLDHTTSGSDNLDFTGTFRVEMDVTLPEGSAFTLFEATDSTSGRQTARLTVSGAADRALVWTVDDGTTQEDHTFYGSVVGRMAGRATRLRVAAQWSDEGGVQIDATEPTDSVTGTLSTAAWETIAVAASDLTAIETPASTRLWEFDTGSDRVHLIEARILSNGTEVASVTATHLIGPAATHQQDGLVWTVDANAVLHDEGDWDDITSSVRIPEGGISYRRGRSGDQGLHLAGELSAVMDNRTRLFEPGFAGAAYYPKVRPLVPLRFCATYSGTTYPLWQGVTRRFMPRYGDQSGADSVAELAGVDAFRLFNIAKTGGALGTVLSGLSPVALWPLTDTGATFDDTAGSNHLTATAATMAAESPFFGGKNRVAYFDGAADGTDSAADSVVEVTGDASVAFVVNTTVGGDYHIASGYGTGGCYWGVELDCAEGQAPIVRWIRNDGTPTDAGNDIALDVDYAYFLDGKPHVCVVTYDQSEDTAVVYVDGAKVATSTDAVPAGNGTPAVAGTATVKVGEEGTHGSGTSNFVGLLGYVALFGKVLSDGEALSVTRCRVDGFRSQTPAARINALLDAYGWPTSARDIDTVSTVEPSDPEAVFDGVASGAKGGDANISVTIPATAQVGGYCYAAIAWPSNRTMDTVPSGWTSVESDQSGSTSVHVETQVWRHVVAASEPGTTVTFVRSNGAGVHSWISVAVSEVDTATPETATTSAGASASTSHPASSVTAAEGDLLVTFHASFSTTTTLTSYTSGPAGMVLLVDVNSSNKGSSQRANLAAWYELNVAAGATGTRTATRSASEPYATMTVAVNAATPSGVSGALSSKDMADASFLTELQAVATAEGGELFIAADGDVVFHSRTWRTTNSGTEQITFGNIAAETDYQSVAYRYDEDRIVNEATVTDADSNDATVRDEASIEVYGLRSTAETVDLTGASAAGVRAKLLVDTLKEPRLLLDGLSVVPASDAATLFPALFGLGLGERVRVRHRPPGWVDPAVMLDAESYLESVEVSCRSTSLDWVWLGRGSEATTVVGYLRSVVGPDVGLLLPLDDATGPAEDESGNGHDFTTTGGTPTRQVAGAFTGELATRFGIVDRDRRSTTQDELDITKPWTVTAWAKANGFIAGTSRNGDVFVLHWGYWGARGVSLMFIGAADDIARIMFVDYGTGQTILHSPNAGSTIIGTWYHLAVSYDGTTIRLYVDGVGVGTTLTVTPTQPNTSDDMYLGAGWKGSTNDDDATFDLQALAFIERALTATEIAELANYSPT